MGPALLIVDDNPKNLQSMEALLGNAGAELTLVDSGKAALLEILKKDFALILLDVQMPELDGYETARLIRQRERSRTVPIIFVTAHNRTDSGIARAYELGAVDFLFKPVVSEILKAKVQVFLDLHRRTLEVQQQAELLRSSQKREHERSLAAAKVEFERKRLEEEAARSREHQATLEKKAEELAQLILEKEAAHLKLERHARRLQLLTESADELLRAQDPEICWKILGKRVVSALGADAFFRFSASPDGGFRLADTLGLSAEDVRKVGALGPDSPLAKWVQTASRRSAHDDVTKQFPALAALRLTSAALYPITRDGQVKEVLGVGAVLRRHFDEGDLSLLQIMSDQAVVAVERAELLGRLREDDRRKDEFIAMLGHELRNPLTPIQNSLEVLRVRAGDDEVAQRSIAASDRQVRHVVRLVDDLLDVSRITRGKVELRRERVRLLPLVEQALHAVEPLVRRKQQSLQTHLPDDVRLTVDVDPNRLVQVLANLLGNAAKYTPEGGQIRLEVVVEGTGVTIAVTDTGIGIRPDMLSRIFDIFVQATPSADRLDAGLGIGLTLARRLAELHGGSLHAHSDGPGRGSTFRLELPQVVVAHLVELPARKKAGAKEISTVILDVLLVEDNEDIRETLKDLLSLHGHRIHEAADGLEGAKLLLALEPDVALIDIGLPELDGYGVARRTRKDRASLRTKLVALTGYGTEEDRKKALDAGFDAHLSKPVTFEDLLALFARLGLNRLSSSNSNVDSEKKDAHADDDQSARDQRTGA